MLAYIHSCLTGSLISSTLLLDLKHFCVSGIIYVHVFFSNSSTKSLASRRKTQPQTDLDPSSFESGHHYAIKLITLPAIRNKFKDH